MQFLHALPAGHVPEATIAQGLSHHGLVELLLGFHIAVTGMRLMPSKGASSGCWLVVTCGPVGGAFEAVLWEGRHWTAVRFLCTYQVPEAGAAMLRFHLVR